MNRMILVAHGKLADEMKNSAEMICGALSEVSSIEFLKEDGFDTIQEKISAQMTDTEASYLIFTDLFGGTPYNASCGITLEQTESKIRVLSGMSLPLVLETANMLSHYYLDDIVKFILRISSETVKVFQPQLAEEQEEF